MRSVFVSKPNTLLPAQEQFWDDLKIFLWERDLNPRSLGETDYSNITPIGAVRSIMIECQGAIILGMKQIRVIDAIIKEGTARETRSSRMILPTAWNHIEAGMAFALDLPILIIREEGVCDGVFGVGSSDRFIHTVPPASEGWLHTMEFLQPFNGWQTEVLRREIGRDSKA